MTDSTLNFKMRELIIPGRNGYPIPALSAVTEESEQILLCLRGFGGGGRSAVVDMLAEKLAEDRIGVFTFDWPGHGRSTVGGDELTVAHCLSDLDAVLEYIRRNYLTDLKSVTDAAPLSDAENGRFGKPVKNSNYPEPAATENSLHLEPVAAQAEAAASRRRVSCFATSFGGYLAALYRNRHPEAFASLILRSPALRMADIVRNFVPEEERAMFLRGGKKDFGFGRELLLGYSFLTDLERWHPFDESVPRPEEVLIIQGDRDTVVDPEDTKNYAAQNGIRVNLVKGAGHQYKNPGETDAILSHTREFLLKKPDSSTGQGITAADVITEKSKTGKSEAEKHEPEKHEPEKHESKKKNMGKNEIITGTVAKAADRIAMDEMGYDSLTLMENASRAVSDYIIRKYPDPTGLRILSVCGVGNNGADGVCIACQLAERGYDATVLVAGKQEKATEEFRFQLERYRKTAGREPVWFTAGTALPEADILVDAVFGIGLKRPVEGILRELLEKADALRQSGNPRFNEVIAVDAPSGINTDTGELMGCGIRADVTITFGRNKTGLVTGDGPAFAGTVLVKEIGIPDEAYKIAAKRAGKPQ